MYGVAMYPPLPVLYLMLDHPRRNHLSDDETSLRKMYRMPSWATQDQLVAVFYLLLCCRLSPYKSNAIIFTVVEPVERIYFL